jgi:hypothetical protein
VIEDGSGRLGRLLCYTFIKLGWVIWRWLGEELDGLDLQNDFRAMCTSNVVNRMHVRLVTFADFSPAPRCIKIHLVAEDSTL